MKQSIYKLTLGGIVGVASAALLITGCHAIHSDHAGKAPTAVVYADKGGAQLWAENCVRCHNIRSPSTYSDVEWDVAMHHMRIRANLTAEEHRKILQFLKSAN